jgi:hypothetical protein
MLFPSPTLLVARVLASVTQFPVTDTESLPKEVVGQDQESSFLGDLLFRAFAQFTGDDGDLSFSVRLEGNKDITADDDDPGWVTISGPFSQNGAPVVLRYPRIERRWRRVRPAVTVTAFSGSGRVTCGLDMWTNGTKLSRAQATRTFPTRTFQDSAYDLNEQRFIP